VPKPLDPSIAALRMGLPEARPSEKIAKLFPQTPPAKDAGPTTAAAAAPAAPAGPLAVADDKSAANDKKTTGSQPAAPGPPTQQPAQAATVASAVPLPQARPELLREKDRAPHRRRHRS
jgi:membrane-bound lytic murein transglycosylase A